MLAGAGARVVRIPLSRAPAAGEGSEKIAKKALFDRRLATGGRRRGGIGGDGG
jgi:hypothetical protein